MAKPYAELRAKMSPESRAKAETETQRLLQEIEAAEGLPSDGSESASTDAHC